MKEEVTPVPARTRHTNPWHVYMIRPKVETVTDCLIPVTEEHVMANTFADLADCEKACCAMAEETLGVIYVPVKVGRRFVATEEVEIVVRKT